MLLKFHLLLLIFPVCVSFQNTRKWTVFKFVQEWPSTVCGLLSKCHKIPAVVSGWTVHGLWPSNKDSKKYIESCNNSWPFNWNRIKSLELDLQKHWPDLLSGGTKQHHMFWRAEWDKHGTCATNVAATANEYKYFKKALDLNTQLNITRALQESSITPSCNRTYDVCYIQKAIKDNLNLASLPQVVYQREKSSHRQLLEQVQICMKKDFTYDSCTEGEIICEKGLEVYIYPEHKIKCP